MEMVFVIVRILPIVEIHNSLKHKKEKEDKNERKNRKCSGEIYKNDYNREVTRCEIYNGKGMETDNRAKSKWLDIRL